MSTSENDDGDDDCYYEMEPLPQIQNSKLLTTTEILDTCEPSTPDDLDENFYQIDDSPPLENTCHHYIDEPFTPSIETVAIPNFHYSVLSQDEYIELMMNYVQEVKDILKLSSPIVKLLLHYFKWNKQKLMENFYDNENHDDLFLQAKIVNPFSIPPSEIEQNEIICSICCSDEQKDMYSLDCKHVFCKDCWKHYLINQIVNEGLGQTISCPETNCDVLVDDETVSKFIADNDFVKHLYKRIIINSYVANNPRARWCPGKNCGCIINATSLTSAYNYAQFIICSNCDMSFCFQCAHPWHDPIKCVFVLKWNKKLVDDSETIIWMKANTKCCPKCRVTIEKNGGCNHMSCKHCNYEFCWLCSGKHSIGKGMINLFSSTIFCVLRIENGNNTLSLLDVINFTFLWLKNACSVNLEH
ncbi:unnamed protein product [Didymodactylos carnosus]|uniref:RBR-type E3 ubiquitin transferase n=1 Tax=Didymodactylos carnosus TaxID=1234261 RepID=A0A8S2CL63_9BILA|nr:unnamed protein product [Didymodactylos carnosus]CAF3510582.1 unnamed protein product [Didymodactylos carnosus]